MFVCSFDWFKGEVVVVVVGELVVEGGGGWIDADADGLDERSSQLSKAPSEPGFPLAVQNPDMFELDTLSGGRCKKTKGRVSGSWWIWLCCEVGGASRSWANMQLSRYRLLRYYCCYGTHE